MGPLIECVPNFSEGLDYTVIEALTAAVARTPGVAVLDRHIDPDHNRSVLTFAGSPEQVAAAALEAVGVAVERIDLNRHTGVHPRIGAADVVPFVPVRGATLDECVRLAHAVGREIWTRFSVPVYFYEAAARCPERARLELIRRGRFEQLRQEVLTHPERRPDIGGPALHPTAGAAVVGARKFLVAYNINLRTADLDAARKIARAVRASSGGLACVKAIGLYLPSRGWAQVSMNLTDFEQTAPQAAFEAVRDHAARLGVELAGGELIGLVPAAALAAGDEWLHHLTSCAAVPVLEDRIAVSSLDE